MGEYSGVLLGVEKVRKATILRMDIKRTQLQFRGRGEQDPLIKIST